MTHANRALAQGATPWPDEDELVELMKQVGTFAGVASLCGKRRESLRDYLRVRPELRKRMLRYSRRLSVRPVAELRAEATIRRSARRERHGSARRGDDNAMWELLLRGDLCSYCRRRPVEVTDHIHPASAGGAHSWDNYTGACFPCNSSKGTKPLLLWLLDHWSALPA
jgi:5-methylcytosine-specific restriction endonuclease McrA